MVKQEPVKNINVLEYQGEDEDDDAEYEYEEYEDEVDELEESKHVFNPITPSNAIESSKEEELEEEMRPSNYNPA